MRSTYLFVSFGVVRGWKVNVTRVVEQTDYDMDAVYETPLLFRIRLFWDPRVSWCPRGCLRGHLRVRATGRVGRVEKRRSDVWKG